MGAIRKALDLEGHQDVSIMAYTAKCAFSSRPFNVLNVFYDLLIRLAH